MTYRPILWHVLLIITSLGLAQLVCYYFIDSLEFNPSKHMVSFLSMRLFVAVLFYTALNWVWDKKINSLNKDILFLSYLVLGLSLSWLRPPFPYSPVINLNLLEIAERSLSYILLNLIVYVPFGYYLRWKLKLANKYLMAIFLIYISLVEYGQHYFRTGFFDIVDVFLNSSGFLLGVVLYTFARKIGRIDSEVPENLDG